MEILKENDTSIESAEQYTPNNPIHYKIKKTKDILILPISNLLVNFDVKKALYELREKLNREYIDVTTPKLREKILQLNTNLRGSFVKFLKGGDNNFIIIGFYVAF